MLAPKHPAAACKPAHARTDRCHRRRAAGRRTNRKPARTSCSASRGTGAGAEAPWRERERTASQRAQVVSVTVTLATDREAELRLSYQVRGTGWQPTYRATLDAAKPSVLLERQALVAQNSGEDWSNVQLTLSTGQPGRTTQGRLPRPWTLDIAPPTPKAAPVARHGHGPAPAPHRLARRSVPKTPCRALK